MTKQRGRTTCPTSEQGPKAHPPTRAGPLPSRAVEAVTQHVPGSLERVNDRYRRRPAPRTVAVVCAQAGGARRIPVIVANDDRVMVSDRNLRRRSPRQRFAWPVVDLLLDGGQVGGGVDLEVDALGHVLPDWLELFVSTGDDVRRSAGGVEPVSPLCPTGPKTPSSVDQGGGIAVQISTRNGRILVFHPALVTNGTSILLIA